jgi:hypothetical protein
MPLQDPARADWQARYRRSRLIGLVWDAAQGGPACAAHLASAQPLGTPIRLLCLDDTPVPDALGAGDADWATARVASPEAGARQIQRWLAELPEAPAGGGTP